MGSQHADESEEEQDPAAPTDDQPRAKIFYLTMPSERGLRTLLTAWKRFSSNKPPASKEEKRLWDVFGYLADFRTWSVQDRIDPSLVRYVNALLLSRPDGLVSVEVDLWYRTEQQRRDQSVEKLRAITAEYQGEFVDVVDIPEINYQGVLLRLPGRVARQMIEGGDGLARLDDIMRIRPQSAFDGDIMDGPQVAPSLEQAAVPDTNTQCVAALLDGYPVLDHDALRGRVVVHEVDVTAAQVQVGHRIHGTAMASLVAHGDLRTSSDPLPSRIAVIPVLTGGGAVEGMPAGKLAIGVIYRALQALVRERQSETSALSRVVVVNHSICDTYAPFVRASSPWACLIDHFSHSNRLLFIVSAGNIKAPIPIKGLSSAQELIDMNPQERDALVIDSLRESSGTRGLLCPAETLNGLSIGALHFDDSPEGPDTEIDPFLDIEMISLGSALGLGLNRSVKPDLVESGGRGALSVSVNSDGAVQVHPSPSSEMGHKVARPGLTGESNRYGLSMGTSDAAALTTRSAVQIATMLEEVFQQDGERWSDKPTRAVMLKALLVHGARWGSVGELFFNLIKDPDNHHHRVSEKDQTSRFVGFGKPDSDRVLGGTKNRITLLADDQIKHEDRHVFRLPVPSHMLKSRDLRTVTITLAWTSPVHVSSVDYRAVTLKLVDGDGQQKFWQGVDRGAIQAQPVQFTMERGTIAHLQLSGDTLWRYGKATDAQLEIAVQAMAKHESMKHIQVPYALAITLEVAQGIDTKVYEEIRDQVRERQGLRTRAATRRN
ncbi:UNVERIFIED_CONTAM: subtilase family protein [Acidovorax defluvii]